MIVGGEYEKIFRKANCNTMEYEPTYGLWLNIAIIIVLQMYCIYIAKSNNINTVN